MTDSDTYAKQMLKVAVCRVAGRTGFKQIDAAALDALADAAANFIEAIGKSCATFAAHTREDGDCSIAHLDSALAVAFKQHNLKPRKQRTTVVERMASRDAELEHGILPIPAELDYQEHGAAVPVASTTAKAAAAGRGRGPRGAAAGPRESAQAQVSRQKILRNVPPALHNLLPGSFTFKGTKVFASVSNTRLARKYAEAEAGSAAAAAVGGTGYSEDADTLQKKEDYYAAKSQLRSSLNTLWGSTTTFNAQIDREAYEDQRQHLQQQQQHQLQQQAFGSGGGGGGGGSGSGGGGGMGMPRGRGGAPAFRKRANSSDLSASSSASSSSSSSSSSASFSSGARRPRDDSIDGVPGFFSGSSRGGGGGGDDGAPEKRARLVLPAAAAAAAAAATTPVAAPAAADAHIAPIDSSKIEPEEPPTVLVAENKR